MTCDICKSVIKTKDSGTTNLLSHLKIYHHQQHAEVAPHSKAKKITPSPSQTRSQPTLGQSWEGKQPYAKEGDRHRMLTQSVANFLVSGE